MGWLPVGLSVMATLFSANSFLMIPGEVNRYNLLLAMALVGTLGAGKTRFTQGLARGLGVPVEEVTSPTFTLLHEYDGMRDEKPIRLYHLDVYRLEGERQLETLGLDELLTPDALIFVEWGDKFKSIRKRATGEIVIASAGGDARKITVTLKDETVSAQSRSPLPEGK